MDPSDSEESRTSRLPVSRPLLCAITDRRCLPDKDVLRFIRSVIAAGVDLIQIREGDMPVRELHHLVREAVALPRGTGSRTLVLVNDRLDVTATTNADGIHLPTRGLPAKEVRRHCPDLVIGASTHNLAELHSAEQAGADFVIFGPVFTPLSKSNSRTPTGLETLAEAVASTSIPVLALGGITEENAASCLKAGAAGLAGITLFQTSTNPAATVQRLRASAE